MITLAQDLRHAFRMLRKHPGTTFLAVLSLALGIGANTAIFSTIYALILRPLPYPAADQIYQVWSAQPTKGWDRISLSLPDAEDLVHAGIFQQAATLDLQAASLTGEGDARRVVMVSAGAGFFDILGLPADLGRTLRSDEAGPGAPRVMVLSHGFWVRQFGADPSVVGRTVQIDGEATEIIGVMPATFEYPTPSIQAWIPSTAIVDPTRRGTREYRMVARLAPGLTAAAASERLTALGGRLAESYPASNQGMGFALQSLHDGLYGPQFRTVSAILMVAVLAVLLVACANVANLLLARAATRSREAALRSALGATRGRLMRQYLLESVTLAVAGGAAGLLVALWGMDALTAMLPRGVARASEIGMNLPVFGFALMLTLVSGLLFGLAPALRSAETKASEVLKDGGRGQPGGRRAGRLRSTLVVVELAVAVTLVISAGLMLRSFAALRQVDPGFQPEHLLTVGVALPGPAFRNDSLIEGYAERARAALAALPGVTQVALADILPGGPNNNAGGFTIVGLPEPRPEDRPNGNQRVIGPDYFETLQVPIRRGRAFTREDRSGSEPVAIINETLARRFFGDRDPVGARINLGSVVLTVVGIVADFRERKVEEEPWPTFYLPFAQFPDRNMDFALRTAGDPAALGGPAREALRALDPLVPVGAVSTMIARQAESRNGDWILTRLLALLGGLALVLASAGVFGVMAYTVSQRTSEFGVRMAIGAGTPDILRLVLRQGLTLGGIGIGAGLVLAFAGTRVLGKFLAGLSPLDPWTYLAVTALLFGAVLLACYLPARRATRVDPMHTLRAE